MTIRVDFTDEVIRAAWNRSGGRCECRRRSHNHPSLKCSKKLVFNLRGSEQDGGWEAHHINSNGDGSLSNCEILCQWCHKHTQSYGS